MTLRRIIALIIDWVAAILVTQVIPGVSGYGTKENSFVTLLVFASQLILLTWLTGSSFGQRITGLRIVHENGSRIRLIQCFIRTFLIVLVFPPLLADKENRGMHDRLARTRILQN